MTLRHDEALERSRTITLRSVQVELDLSCADDLDIPTFGSRSRLEIDCHEPGAGTFLDLKAESLHEVRVNGVLVEQPDWDGNRLRLSDLAEQNIVEVTATMRFSSDGEGLHRHHAAGDGTYLYAMSFLDAAPRWFCTVDQPDQKARHSFDVQAPDGWIVRGNDTDKPLASYLVTLVAGPWVEITRGRLGLLARRGLSDELHRDAEDLFEVTNACLAAYEDLIGIPYAFGDYLQVFAPDFNAGAMENPGCVVLREQFLHRGQATQAQRASRAGTIAHELAHQWFGDLVTMRWWDDLWLNESFAEYLGHRICTEHTQYPLWADFGLRRKTWGLAADKGPNTHPVAGNGAEDTTAALANFDGISYAKGAAVLRQLAAWMGDQAFFAGLRHHISTHAHGNASRADLVDAWRAQGVDGLDDWLDAWLTTSGPDRIQVLDGPLRLERVGTPKPRPHALHVEVRTPQGSLRDERRAVAHDDLTPLDLRHEPGDLVLPDADDTAWASIRPLVVGGADLTSVAAHRLPTTPRAALLGLLHDALRDARVAPGALLDQLLAMAAVEPDATLLAAALDLARACATVWSPPDVRPARGARLADAALHLLEGAEPKGDHHLLAQCAVIASTTHTDVLHGLLAGETPRPLGPEERWRAIQSLVALGEDARLVDDELARDPSSSGQLHALTARASAPASSVKRAALDRVLHDAQASAYQVSAIAAGIFLPGQYALVQPLAVEWFAGISQTSRLRQGWGLTGTVRAGFPHGVADEQVLDAARRTLADPEVHPTVRRTLADGFDDLVRQSVSWKVCGAS